MRREFIDLLRTIFLYERPSAAETVDRIAATGDRAAISLQRGSVYGQLGLRLKRRLLGR